MRDVPGGVDASKCAGPIDVTIGDEKRPGARIERKLVAERHIPVAINLPRVERCDRCIRAVGCGRGEPAVGSIATSPGAPPIPSSARAANGASASCKMIPSS